MPDQSATTTIEATSPAIGAASAVAALVNALWNGEEGLPTVEARLSPRIDVEAGTEAIPAAYAIPSLFQMDRAGRGVYEDTVEVALVLTLDALTDDVASSALNVMHYTVRQILETGASDGVKFVKADYVELFDYDLLCNARIFRSQVNIRCKVLE